MLGIRGVYHYQREERFGDRTLTGRATAVASAARVVVAEYAATFWAADVVADSINSSTDAPSRRSISDSHRKT